MEDKKQEVLSPEEHSRQIDAYSKELEIYQTYAHVLERVLKSACSVSIPAAFVQARAKTLSSFAEKCVRRYDRYPNAVIQMTDLCGARVIVQTNEQVQSVCKFIEGNFAILEKDDKGLLLDKDKFGYRDMHYIIQILPDRCPQLGVDPATQQQIGERRAEVQVRTWLQHAWADTLHDRIYKNSLRLSPDLLRAGSLLAALMEEGDRNFGLVAGELDGMAANYTAFAPREEVRKEIEIQELILQNEPHDQNKPALALKLARLLEACGAYEKVVAVLNPFSDVQDGTRPELLQHLGFALCRANSQKPQAPHFLLGKGYLEEALKLYGNPDLPFIPERRKLEGLRARTLSSLGWVEEQIKGHESEARKRRCQAHELEPSNPYYLAEMLGFEMRFPPGNELSTALKILIQEAAKTCRQQALASIELPFAYFTAGRLSLLLKEDYQALDYYARGVRHYLAAEYCFPEDVLDEEEKWLENLHYGKEPSELCHWLKTLFDLTRQITTPKTKEPDSSSEKILIITGGAASMTRETLDRIRPLVEKALRIFQGKVICGGTVSGVPGLVGEIAGNLAAQEQKHFELIAYIPRSLPHDAPKDERYNDHIICGLGKFSPKQILCSWEDLLSKGVDPKTVLLLGFGGGPLSAFEYRLALALGATVGIVDEVGGAARELMEDALWARLPNLMPIPFDPMSLLAFVTREKSFLDEPVLEEMARAFHANFVINSPGRMPDNMKPWDLLNQSYRRANIKQARYAIHIIEACGYRVRPGTTAPDFQFDAKDIDCMAEMEHGRWNIERLQDRWRFGHRNDKEKLHNCLVKWADLPDEIKKYDIEAVTNYPKVLAQAGLEIYK